jgi:hypothetical protein
MIFSPLDLGEILLHPPLRDLPLDCSNFTRNMYGCIMILSKPLIKNGLGVKGGSMSATAESLMTISKDELKDEIITQVTNLGAACAADLAAQIGRGVTTQDLIPILESLTKKGVLRHREKDLRDQRTYTEHQIVYEPKI